MSEILVSILCMTYNHKSYIQDALESFLEQKVNFKYEIIIHDDASTDGTAEVIKSYEQKYPNLIKGIYEVENQYNRMIWLLYSFIQNVCKGEYVAICEGDDYWIDFHKLQMQVEYLEAYSECVLTVHNAFKKNYRDDTIKAMCPYENEGVLSSKEVILQNRESTPTASMVLRRSAMDMDLNSFFVKVGAVGDYPLMLYLLKKGTIFYFNKVMSVYRYMHTNSWSEIQNGKNNLKLFLHVMEMIDFLMNYNVYTDAKYEKYIISRIHIYIEYLLSDIFEYKTPKGSFEYFLKLCGLYDKETEFKYHEYCLEIERIVLLTLGQDACKEQIYRYIEGKKYIVLYGTGVYSDIIEKIFEKLKIKIDGFVVSDDQKIDNSKKNKPIWKISKLPFEKESLGIVVSINPRIWDEIIYSLEKENIQDYICPFLFRNKKLHTTG